MYLQPFIHVEKLRKHYGAVKAVDGVSFDVQEGEIFGMVGPNGSGKTTTIECIEGLREPDEGIVHVLGLDPRRDYYALRERTGVQLQSSNLPPRMRVAESLELFASFYSRTADWQELLDELGLGDKRRTYFSQLSGGQKQRLFIALALINQPEIVFLDELTTGLDPQARHATWDLVRQVRQSGTTVFLTTHFMDEAQNLCDRVAILNQGRFIAMDTPQDLINQLGMDTRIVFSINNSLQPIPTGNPTSPAIGENPLAHIGVIDGVKRVENDHGKVTIYGKGDGLLGTVIHALEDTGLTFHDLHTEQPDLEDVFLSLTGEAMRN